MTQYKHLAHSRSTKETAMYNVVFAVFSLYLPAREEQLVLASYNQTRRRELTQWVVINKPDCEYSPWEHTKTHLVAILLLYNISYGTERRVN